MVGQVDGEHEVAALAQKLAERGGPAVQRVGHFGRDGQLTVRVALVVNIGVVGVPDQRIAVPGVLSKALGVHDIFQGGPVLHTGEAVGIVKMLADGGLGDRAVRCHDGIHRLILREGGLGRRKGGLTEADRQGQGKRRRASAAQKILSFSHSIHSFAALGALSQW